LFGRHVLWRAENLSGAGRAGPFFHHLHDSEIEDFDLRRAIAPQGQEQIFGFEIPVHESQAVGLVKSPRHWPQPFDHSDRIWCRARRYTLEVGAFEQFHDQERRAAELGGNVGVRHTHDAFALYTRRGTHLVPEARERFG
jgi:hypothetical protein